MGVIRERKFVCEAAVRSNPESVHSGYTTQESEDEETQGETSRRQPLRTAKGLNLNFNINITKHSGRRKTRRVLNNKFLETLKEEEEIDEVVMNVNKSKFQILMEETEDALDFLNSHDNFNFEPELFHSVTGFKYIDPYFSIPRKIRVAISNKKNFRYDLLKSLEDIITSFIYSHPSNTNYFHFPRNCYERFLVHAVAKYNGLYSETISLEGGRAVKVHRGLNNLMPQAQLLCDFINGMKNCDDIEE